MRARERALTFGQKIHEHTRTTLDIIYASRKPIRDSCRRVFVLRSRLQGRERTPNLSLWFYDHSHALRSDGDHWAKIWIYQLYLGFRIQKKCPISDGDHSDRIAEVC